MKYAIVDIETTGGSAKTSAITEIAIVTVENGREVDRYETLVNPMRKIPQRITAITGISDEMVADAPAFHEVAGEVWNRTHDTVFVAHNVMFDYSFIREQFAQLGAAWRPKRLCTVRLSRKLMPNLYSYSLGKIADQMGRAIDGRHRAMGDCAFTAELFLHLCTLDHEGHIDFALNAKSREAMLPPMLNRDRFENLPNAMGVYIFKGAKGKVLYVGKANNLKKRVVEHFRGSTHTGLKQRFAEKIEDVDWLVCSNELMALLHEAILIKKHWPPYNNAMKRVSLNWGIFNYVDQNGYQRYSIGRVGKWDRPVYSFKSAADAKIRLEFLCSKYQLCKRLCGLQALNGQCLLDLGESCSQACTGGESASDYNKRFFLSLNELMLTEQTMTIAGKGFTDHERSVILIEAGRFKGYGMVPASIDLNQLPAVKAYLETGYDDQDIQSVIMGYLSREKNDQEVFIQ